MKLKKIALVVVALLVSGMALFWHRFMQQHDTIKNICRTAVGMNMEALRAAIAGGATAVYLGGKSFSAAGFMCIMLPSQ